MKIDVYKIKVILAEKEMTRSALAGLCGISRQNISTILTRGTCALKTAGKLAKGLGISVAEIIKQED